MRYKIFLIPELQMLLQNERIQKLNFSREWLIDMEKKITI